MAMANYVNAGRRHHEIYAHWRVTMGHRMLFHGSLPPCVDLHSLVSRKISLLPMAFPLSPVSLMVFRIILFPKVFHVSLFHHCFFVCSPRLHVPLLPRAWLSSIVLGCAWLCFAVPGCTCLCLAAWRYLAELCNVWPYLAVPGSA